MRVSISYRFIYLFIVFIFVLSQMTPILSSRVIPLGLGIISFAVSTKFKSNFSAGKEYKMWMLGFLLFILLSTIWSIDPWLTIYALIINVFPIFCLTYSLSRYINSYDRLIDILQLIYLSGLISLIYLFLFVDLSQIAGNRIGDAMMDEELADTWNVNAIGMNLSLSILIGYLVIKYRNIKILWLVWTVISIAMLVTIMLTGSRKALLLIMLPFLIFALYDYKKHFLKAILMVVAALGFVWLALNVEFFYDIVGRRIEDLINMVTGNETGREDNSRMVLIMLGLDWFSESPFVGYGMNCFRVLSNIVPRFAGKNFYAHNNYIEILVGGGIVGFCVYYSYVILLLRRIIGHSRVYFRYAAICLSIVLVMDFAQVSYYDVIMQMIIVFAFILVRLKPTQKLQNEKNRRN